MAQANQPANEQAQQGEIVADRKIGNEGDTPEQAAVREGFTIVRVYPDGSVVARRGTRAFVVRKPYATEKTPFIVEGSSTGLNSAIGEFEDSPSEAAARFGMRILKTGVLGEKLDVLAVDQDGMVYHIHRTGNGPFRYFFGFSDDPEMPKWLEW